MSATSTTNEIETVTQAPLKGKNLLFALLCGGLGVILVAVLFKRIIHRFSFKYTLRSHLPGHKASKKVKKAIQNQLNQIAAFSYEPYWLLEKDDKRNGLLESFNENNCPSENQHLYRLKTIDGFRKIDEYLGNINPILRRPCERPMLQHLLAIKSHSSGCFNFLHRSDLETLSNIYHHARFSPKNFSLTEYMKFQEILDEVLTLLQNPNEVKKRKSLYKSHRKSAVVSVSLQNDDDHLEIELIQPENNLSEDKPLIAECSS